MKTRDEIYNDLVADMVSEQDKVKWFGKDGAIRGAFWSWANTMSEAWNDIYQVKRQMQEKTAKGSDLDELAARKNVTRAGATKSSVTLTFRGPYATTLPAGTKVQTLSGMIYETTIGIILGQNADIVGNLFSQTLGDTVLAESVETGTKTSVGVNQLSILTVPISGVTVTNLVPSVGGRDIESDSELRSRLAEYGNTFALGTQAFYESIAKTVEPSVYKCIAEYNRYTEGVTVYLAKNTLVDYTSEELTAIAALIYDKQRAFTPVNCMNIYRKEIRISFQYTRDTAYTNNQVYSSFAVSASAYLDALRSNFGATISYQEILKIIFATKGVKYLNLSSFTINAGFADIVCGAKELPVLVGIKMNDGTNIAFVIKESVSLL